MNITVFKPTEQCRKCEGSCCKHMACHFSPSDFKEITFESLKKEIEKGFISIDWWEDEKPQYYLRMRHKNEPIVCGSWGGECILLTEKGCPLSFEDRPLGARALKPKDCDDGYCHTYYDKKQCKNDWSIHDSILCELVKYFK